MVDLLNVAGSGRGDSQPPKDTQCLHFSRANFARLRKGKTTSVRLGEKSYSLGHCILSCEAGGEFCHSEITEIRVVRFGDLGLLDAVADGFNSVEELRREIQHCYKKIISDYEPVTVVRFKLA